MDPLVPLSRFLQYVPTSSDVWKIIVILICIILGGFFAAAETALSQCNRFKLAARAESGNKNAKIVLKILDKFDNSIINILICINVTHIVPSIIATYLFASMMPNNPDAASLIATVLMTILIFLFSEMLPKNIANLNSDKIAEIVAIPIYFTGIILTPISLFFRGIVYLVKKVFKVNGDENKLTEDDFQDTVDDILDEGKLDEEECEIINAAVEFGDFTVMDVITPIEKMVMYNYKHQARRDLIKYLSSIEYSRIPVYEEDINNIIGILHVKKYLMSINNSKNYYAFKSILSKPLFISHKTKIDDLMEIFQEKRTHIAIVKSDDDKIIGMVTLDDLAEKLVGDLDDTPSISGGNN